MSGPVLFTVTAALTPEEDAMIDIELTSAEAKLVDLPAGADILELDGSKRLENTAARTCTSPFATTTQGGTSMRAIYWSRGADPTLLLGAYTNQCQNIRPVESSGGSSEDVAAAVADRDAEWVDALTAEWPVKP